MKKVFAFVAMMGLLTFGVSQTINAQETEAPAAEEVAQNDSAAVEEAAAETEAAAPAAAEEDEPQGLHNNLSPGKEIANLLRLVCAKVAAAPFD